MRQRPGMLGLVVLLLFGGQGYQDRWQQLAFSLPFPCHVVFLCHSSQLLSQQQAKRHIPKNQKREGMEIRSVMFITRSYSERYPASFFKIKLLRKSVIVSYLFNICQNQLPTTSVVKLEVSIEDLDFFPPEYTYLVSPPQTRRCSIPGLELGKVASLLRHVCCMITIQDVTSSLLGGFCSHFWIASMAGSCFSGCIRVFSESLQQQK